LQTVVACQKIASLSCKLLLFTIIFT